MAHLHVVKVLLDKRQIFATDLFLELVNLVVLHSHTNPLKTHFWDRQ